MTGYETVAVLLGISALFAFVNERFLKLPTTIGIFLLAFLTSIGLTLCMVIGPLDAHASMRAFVESIDFGKILMDGMLSFLLFAGALHVPIRLLEEEAWPIFALAVLSTTLNTALVGGASWLVLTALGVDISIAWALLFGALISPTDPIAALAILSKAGLPKRLETLFSGESLFNDGIGVVLFTILAGAAAGALDEPAHGTGGHVALIATEVGGGLLAGLALGGLTHWMVSGTRERSTHMMITVATVFSGYAACSALHVSAPIATVVAGLIVGNRTFVSGLDGRERHEVHVFWSMIDDLLNGILFVMLGLVYVTVPFNPSIAIAGVAATGICLGSRALSILVTTKIVAIDSRVELAHGKLVALLTWGGLRGGLSIALALSLHASPSRDLLLGMTGAVVAFSLLAQGLTVGKFYTRISERHA